MAKDAEQLARIMRGLKCSEEEAREVMEYDRAIDREERTQYDLPQDKINIARKFAHAGTRKTPTTYNWEKKPTRKPNATKSGIIEELAQFLTDGSQFETSDIQIKNKEREILLKICGEWYSVTLTYKRNMNKGTE